MSECFDLVVVGGRLDGAALAKSIAERGARRSLRLRLCSGPRTSTDHGVYEITFAEVGR